MCAHKQFVAWAAWGPKWHRRFLWNETAGQVLMRMHQRTGIVINKCQKQVTGTGTLLKLISSWTIVLLLQQRATLIEIAVPLLGYSNLKIWSRAKVLLIGKGVWTLENIVQRWITPHNESRQHGNGNMRRVANISSTAHELGERGAWKLASPKKNQVIQPLEPRGHTRKGPTFRVREREKKIKRAILTQHVALHRGFQFHVTGNSTKQKNQTEKKQEKRAESWRSRERTSGLHR